MVLGRTQDTLRCDGDAHKFSSFLHQELHFEVCQTISHHHNLVRIPRETLPALKSYFHGQYFQIKKLQHSRIKSFNRALATLSEEDTTISFEAVQQYQALTRRHPNPTLEPTVSKLKDFMNGTFKAQQSTLANKKFEAINNDTLLFRPRCQATDHNTSQQNMETCFL